ncbi:HDOD domain-containing protein [Nitrosophilus kaiyonis]|uniref:HDOD domain-containing protein n=1 Tax=Nitrosophilus kaiyonis TaxID=2930200 RepID=UPI00248FE707|nr:HDOD domain-containing protein [Nitrosophilus kaiyonis]
MGLFGFGKNGKKKDNKKEKKIIFLSKRDADRYHVENLNVKGIGKVLDISKNGVAVKKDEIEEVKKESLDIKLEGQEVKASLKRETLKEVGFKFEDEIETEEIIKTHLKKPKKYSFKTIQNLSLEDIENDENIEKIKAVINLMLELDDPNTNVEKFNSHIEALSELERRIIKKANSVESASKSEIKNVTTAITRLGFEEVKNIVYDYINEKISLKNINFSNFENYEFYNILKTSFFKKIAPLFSFRDLRSEGRSLLATETLGIEFLIEKNENDFKNIYKSPKHLYSIYSRIYEKIHFGMDFLDINKDYFLNRLGLFKYLYDGYILAHINRHPYYELSNNNSITLSSRKMRFSYIAYLTFLALEFVLSKDKKSGAILLNRLKRLGFDNSKALSFLNETIYEANDLLEHFGIKNRINTVSYPTININMEKMFGKELHLTTYMEKMELVSKDVNRVALRYEDQFYALFLLSETLNSYEFEFNEMPFCFIPCENLKDEDLKIDMFNGFDILIFKNIDKLSKDLYEDFFKIWRDFEGKVFVTYSAYSMIDFNNKVLHDKIKIYVIDIPSYYDNDYIYKMMLKTTCSEINKELDSGICKVEDYLSEIITMDSVIIKSIENFCKT